MRGKGTGKESHLEERQDEGRLQRERYPQEVLFKSECDQNRLCVSCRLRPAALYSI